MIHSAKQLLKYKQIKESLKKQFPKGKAGYTGFTIDVSYGGNKEVNLKRINLGGIASDLSVNQEFLDMLTKVVEDNISFWENTVKLDIQQLENSLKV